MQKTIQNNSVNVVSRARATAILAVCSCLLIAGLASPFAHADSFDQKIQSLNQQNAQNQQALSVLGAQAASYQDQIAQLQGQINELQSQISENQAKQASLADEIIQKQAEIDRQREILASTLKALYVDDQMTTIEMLATSKNLSDYVDKEEYRTTVQNKVQDTMAEIAQLQKELQSQKTEVDNLLADQKSQETSLASARAQQSQLLAMNQSQQAGYNEQMKSNNSQIAKLRAQQEAAIAASQAGASVIRGGTCGGNYPNNWCSAPQDSMLDKWGMYNRECVSYTAWKVYEAGYHMPYWGGHGNANQWDNNAISAGLRVDDDPTGPAVVAIKNAGTYGHAMWVESVNDNGTINLSQYNANSISDPGKYSKAYNVSTSGLVFIHFQK
jgi:surface antigen